MEPVKPENTSEPFDWEVLGKNIDEQLRKGFPRLSVIIPTYNCAQWMGITLNSIISQRYGGDGIEVVVVDASSSDRTVEVVGSYYDLNVRIYSVKRYNVHEMLNRGISLASGKYITIMFPGDFYVSYDALAYMAQTALDDNFPDVIYCGCLLHDGEGEAFTLFRPLSKTILVKGQQPTSLQSCWFKITTIKSLGKFNARYSLRAALDLFCRIHFNKDIRVKGLRRILLDYEGRRMNYHTVATHFVETLHIVYHYFGLIKAVRWVFIQKDFRRLMCLLLRRCRSAFLRR